MPRTKEIFLCASLGTRAVGSAALNRAVSPYITDSIIVCYNREVICRNIYNRYLLNVYISMFDIDPLDPLRLNLFTGATCTSKNAMFSVLTRTSQVMLSHM